VKREAPVDKTFFRKQTLGNKIWEFIIGALTVSPFPRRQLRILPLPILLIGSLGRQFPDLFSMSCSGAAEKGRGDSASLGLVKAGGGGGWI
jgi:hypothetical protein